MDLTDLSLTQAAAFWQMDLLPSDGLPDIAVRALQAGTDSSSLRLLAGETDRIHSTLAPLFHAALRELRIQLPSQPDAQLTVARYYAHKIVAGAITPYDGARRIWWDAANDAFPRTGANPVWDRLRTFVGLASEWEDDPDRRPDYEREIVAEAEALIAENAA